MTQAERDRLVALKKAKRKLITQKQAAEELGITERHVRRLLRELKRRGDKVVAHGLRGLPSNRKLSANTEREAMAILSQPVYRGFGPTLAAEYLAKKHKIDVNRETVRQWMIEAKLWRPSVVFGAARLAANPTARWPINMQPPRFARSHPFRAMAPKTKPVTRAATEAKMPTPKPIFTPVLMPCFTRSD